MGATSKGCGSCRRRKVKCDGTRPLCTRCRRSGIECTGFAMRLRFVDETPRIRRILATSQARSHQLTCSSGAPRSQWIGPTAPALNLLTWESAKQDLSMNYLVSKLFRGNQHSTQCDLPTEWIAQLVQNPQASHHRAWDAFAAMLYGQAHHRQDAITDAMRLYGQALSGLQQELSGLDDWTSEHLLATITALSMYEALVPNTQKGWMLHADGLGILLERRGPWQQKYSKKSIFLEHRMILIARSIVSSQSTFLRSTRWKSIPWEDNPDLKSTVDYLVDIGTDIAGHRARFEKLANTTKDWTTNHSQLEEQVAGSLTELNTWWSQWEAEYAQFAIEVDLPPTNNAPNFQTVLHYSDLWAAFALCLHNAMRILLLQLWFLLQHHPAPTRSTKQDFILDLPNQTALIGITSNRQSLACEILRSLNYCYGESRRFTYTFSFLFIQDVVYGCLEPSSEEARWAARHGWAESVDLGHTDDANLLKNLTPVGMVKISDVDYDTRRTDANFVHKSISGAMQRSL